MRNFVLFSSRSIDFWQGLVLCVCGWKTLPGRGGSGGNTLLEGVRTICRRQVRDESATVFSSQVADDQRLFISQHVSLPTHFSHRLWRGQPKVYCCHCRFEKYAIHHFPADRKVEILLLYMNWGLSFAVEIYLLISTFNYSEIHPPENRFIKTGSRSENSVIILCLHA